MCLVSLRMDAKSWSKLLQSYLYSVAQVDELLNFLEACLGMNFGPLILCGLVCTDARHYPSGQLSFLQASDPGSGGLPFVDSGWDICNFFFVQRIQVGHARG